MSNTKKKEGHHHLLSRLILRTTGVIVLCLLLGYLALLSGIIEQRAIPFLSDRILGARLNLQVDAFWPLRMRDIQLQQGETAPILKTDSVTVNFRRAASGFLPIIESIDIFQPQFHLDAKSQAENNYAFLQPYLKGGDSEGDPSRWLPQRMTVAQIGMKVDMPAWSATISNVNLVTKISDMDHITAQISSDTVLAGWQSGHEWLDISLPQGTIDANITRMKDTIDIKANMLLPDFMLLDGNASMTLQPFLQLDVMLNTMQLDAPVFGELISQFAPVPLGYDTVNIAPFQLSMSLEDNIPVVKNAEGNMQVGNLLLGTPDAPWYAGDFDMRLQGEYGAGSQATWTATLNKGQQLSGTISTADAAIQFEAALKNWTREDMTNLWPKPYSIWQPWLPNLMDTNSTAKLVYEKDKVLFDGNISTVLPSTTDATIVGAGNYNLNSNILSFKGEGTIGNGICLFEGSKQDLFSADLSVDSVAASDILSCLPWEALRSIKGDITGKASVASDEDRNYAFRINADTAAPAYDNWLLPDTLGVPTVDCKGKIKHDFSTVNATGMLHLADNASVNVNSFRYDIDKSLITSGFDSTVALIAAAGALGYDDLWGEIAAIGTFTLHNWQEMSINPLRLTSDALGYGDFSLPYGEELVIESPVKVDLTDLSFSAGPSRMTLGDGAAITTDLVHVTADRTITTSAISLETDFSPLVSKQFLDSADGQLKISIEDFHYGADVIAGKLVYECNAAHLVLPEKLVDIRGLTATGAAILPPAPDTKGTFQIEELVVGGSKLQQTRGNIFLEKQGIVLEDVNFELFGGGVVARATITIIGAEFLVSLSGEVNNLDLSIFTNEFEPPSVMLTGRVNGTFNTKFTTQELRALDVDLTASDDFSMNRDMVEQLLMSQYVNDMTGGRQMTRVLESVIGEDEQRKFEGARLVVSLEDERIVGYAKLESEKLNLTIDIKADPPALLEALKTRQE